MEERERFNTALQGNVHDLAASISRGKIAIKVRSWPHTARFVSALHAALYLRASGVACHITALLA